MILVDTSIWIELLNGRSRKPVSSEDLLQFVTCDPIVQEVLQARISDPLPIDTYLQAADIYRQGWRKGYTIRSSTDCLIAAIAIENRVPLWHRDRDFAVIAQYTGLEARE